MNTTIIALCGAALLLAAVAASAQNGRSIYQKYSDAENVSAVYISPAMFRLIGKIPDLNLEGENLNLGPLIQSLSGFYLLSSENSEINSRLKADTDRFLRNGNFEMLMETKDSGQTVGMYTVGDEKVITAFVMIAQEAEELTFICLDGKMDRQDVETLIAKAASE